MRLTVAPALLQFFATEPAETGAVTVALPPDVRAEAHDRPEDLFTERPWSVPRPQPASGPGDQKLYLRERLT